MIPEVDTLKTKALLWNDQREPRLAFDVLDGLEQYACSRFDWLSNQFVECRMLYKSGNIDENWFDMAWAMDSLGHTDLPDRPWLKVFKALHSTGPDNWKYASSVLEMIGKRLRPEVEIDRLLSTYLDFIGENIFEDYEYKDENNSLVTVYDNNLNLTSDAKSKIEKTLITIAEGLKSIAMYQAKSICMQQALIFFKSIDYDHFLTEQLFESNDSQIKNNANREIEMLRTSIREREEKMHRLERQVEDYMRIILEDDQRYVKDAMSAIDAFESNWQNIIRDLYENKFQFSTEKEMFSDLFGMIDPKYHKIEQRQQIDGSFGSGRLFFGDLRWFIEKHWDKYFGKMFMSDVKLRSIKSIVCELNTYRNEMAHPQDSIDTKKNSAIKALALLAKYKEMLKDSTCGE